MVALLICDYNSVKFICLKISGLLFINLMTNIITYLRILFVISDITLFKKNFCDICYLAGLEKSLRSATNINAMITMHLASGRRELSNVRQRPKLLRDRTGSRGGVSIHLFPSSPLDRRGAQLSMCCWIDCSVRLCMKSSCIRSRPWAALPPCPLPYPWLLNIEGPFICPSILHELNPPARPAQPCHPMVTWRWRRSVLSMSTTQRHLDAIFITRQ